MKNYESTIKALHDQADALGEDDRESRTGNISVSGFRFIGISSTFLPFFDEKYFIFFTVTERLNSIDKRYQELQELAKLRKQRLLDALSLYKLFTEADGVEQWINEKEKMLVTMVPGKDIEDCEIMKHRFDGFDREMNANASRVAVVNQLARQLLHVEHPNR